MIRTFDSGEVLREDILLRIRHLEAEIAVLQKEMEEIKREMDRLMPKWWWVHIDEEGRTKVVSGKGWSYLSFSWEIRKLNLRHFLFCPEAALGLGLLG